jgi:IS5 family transposase
MTAKKPRNLFKYQSFSDKLLEQLCYDRAYYADPANFNDPLDCLPVVVADVPRTELEGLLAHMVVSRSAKEIDAAMKKVRLRGEKATARRKALTESEVRELLGDIDYNATNPEVEDPEAYILSALSLAIERELRKTHETGVLCLSSKFDSPLMWSHYANQHRGVCVEYDVSMLESEALHRVVYDESREVRASQIRDWVLHNNHAARKAIDTACLLTKAREWAYEGEWRLLGSVGLQESPIKLKSVIFGMRCPPVLEYTVVKALQGRVQAVKFWRIRPPSARFELKRVRTDVNELVIGMPRSSVFHDFDVVSDLDSEGEK